jgi:hypothetical protein
MIKQLVSICILLFCMSSCALLYTPAAEPTPFLRKKDGMAINANLGTNGSAIFAGGNITKPITDVVCINLSGAYGFKGIESWPNSPFLAYKKQMNVAANLGINLTKKTKYPLMFWLGGQVGYSSDSYGLAIFIPPFSKDSAIVASDGITTRYERLSGNYKSIRFGLTHIILSNYDNNFKKRERMKTKFDIMGSPYINLVGFKYTNAIRFNTRHNELLGYGLSVNLSKQNWILSLKADLMQPLVKLTNEIRNIPTDVYHPGFSEIPLVVPSISFTKLLSKKQ